MNEAPIGDENAHSPQHKGGSHNLNERSPDRGRKLGQDDEMKFFCDLNERSPDRGRKLVKHSVFIISHFKFK